MKFKDILTTLTPKSWRTILNVMINVDPTGNSDYIAHLIKRGEYERAYHAFGLRTIMLHCEVFDSSIMLRLVQFKAWTVDGFVWCYQWGRDCDLMEADGIFRITPTIEALELAIDAMYDSAEGPCYLHLISPEVAADFKPTRRDRAAEQMGY